MIMKSLRSRPIGIFDSGVGGLTVARSVRRQLPNEDIIYFGDTARVPYGNKSKATIIRFSREIMDFLIRKKVKMVVVACNTASSFSLPTLRKNYDVPVLGVIAPGVKEAMAVSETGRIGVIGTRSTIKSRSYEKELKKHRVHKKRIFTESCPLFVPLVENKFASDPIARQVAEKYLKGLKTKHVDTLILGCTHYPILKSVIAKVAKGTRLVDSSVAVAKEVKRVLEEEGLSKRRKAKGKMECYVSDDVENFRSISSIFLKENMKVKKAVI